MTLSVVSLSVVSLSVASPLTETAYETDTTPRRHTDREHSRVHVCVCVCVLWYPQAVFGLGGSEIAECLGGEARRQRGVRSPRVCVCV